jgi:hypothetical protein
VADAGGIASGDPDIPVGTAGARGTRTSWISSCANGGRDAPASPGPTAITGDARTGGGGWVPLVLRSVGGGWLSRMSCADARKPSDAVGSSATTRA